MLSSSRNTNRHDRQLMFAHPITSFPMPYLPHRNLFYQPSRSNHSNITENINTTTPKNTTHNKKTINKSTPYNNQRILIHTSSTLLDSRSSHLKRQQLKRFYHKSTPPPRLTLTFLCLPLTLYTSLDVQL